MPPLSPRNTSCTTYSIPNRPRHLPPSNRTKPRPYPLSQQNFFVWHSLLLAHPPYCLQGCVHYRFPLSYLQGFRLHHPDSNFPPQLLPLANGHTSSNLMTKILFVIGTIYGPKSISLRYFLLSKQTWSSTPPLATCMNTVTSCAAPERPFLSKSLPTTSVDLSKVLACAYLWSPIHFTYATCRKSRLIERSHMQNWWPPFDLKRRKNIAFKLLWGEKK